MSKWKVGDWAMVQLSSETSLTGYVSVAGCPVSETALRPLPPALTPREAAVVGNAVAACKWIEEIPMYRPLYNAIKELLAERASLDPLTNLVQAVEAFWGPASKIEDILQSSPTRDRPLAALATAHKVQK